MVAIWKIKTTGEILTVVVTKNAKSFQQLINSHPQMEFIKWSDI